MLNLSPEDNELFRRIDEICYYRWDPIGVSDTARTRDEYRSYVPQIFRRVKDGNLFPIIEYMRKVVTDSMGLDFNRENAKQAALLMLEWRRVIDERRSR